MQLAQPGQLDDCIREVLTTKRVCEVAVPDDAAKRQWMFVTVSLRLGVDVRDVRRGYGLTMHSPCTADPTLAPTYGVQIEYYNTTNGGVKLRFVPILDPPPPDQTFIRLANR